MTDWTISVIQSEPVKGKPLNWMPPATALLKVGVPLAVARRWKRERHDMTVGLRRRIRENRN